MKASLLAALIVGCSASPTIYDEVLSSDNGPIRLCPVELREEYLLASQEIWSAVIDCDHPDYFVTTGQLGSVEFDGVTYTIAGEVTTLAAPHSPGLIRVDVDFWGGPNVDAWQLVEFILAHELGHALGHPHVCEISDGDCTEADRADLMYPIVDWSEDFFAEHPRDHE